MRDAVYKDMFVGCMCHSSLGCQADHIQRYEVLGGKLPSVGNNNIMAIQSLGKLIIGPGVLACATHGGGQSEAGHCFHLFFVCFLRLLLFTHFGESPVKENLFPPIGWPNQKKYL